MNKELFKKTTVILCTALVISMPGGCRSSDSGTDDKAPRTVSTTTEEEATAEPEATSVTVATQTETKAARFEFSWNPHVFSQIDREAIGAEAELFFYDLIDAVIAGDTSVPCADQELLWDLDMAIGEYFPPFHYIVAETVYEDGEVLLQYRLDDEQKETLLEDFTSQIETLIGYAGLLEEDSQTIRAVKIYRMYSGLIRYDYAAADNDVITDVSSYRGLMDLEGICQSFASAYVYLCLQAGVEATSVSGMNTEVAHQWTMLTLNDKYYYADPTFEAGDGGFGLKYFGMTAEQRELAGGFTSDEYNIGNSNNVWGKEIDVTDEVFAPLWEATVIAEVSQKDGALIFTCQKADGSVFEWEVR